MTDDLYRLTPEAVQRLRDSVRWRLHDHREYPAAPFIQWSESEEGWTLHAYGHIQALSKDVDPLLACCRCERHEPGFIRRILDRNEDCTLASLAPDLAAAERARAYEERRRAQDAIAAREATLSRRSAQIDVTKLSLDDLL